MLSITAERVSQSVKELSDSDSGIGAPLAQDFGLGLDLFELVTELAHRSVIKVGGRIFCLVLKGFLDASLDTLGKINALKQQKYQSSLLALPPLRNPPFGCATDRCATARMTTANRGKMCLILKRPPLCDVPLILENFPDDPLPPRFWRQLAS